MGDYKELHLSVVLKHYKRPEIQKAIAACAEDKEVVGSYGGKGYAKRPDVLMYPADVMELVKKGVTSFHASEERWNNPLLLVPGVSKRELDVMRKGWDLVLDIDCPIWELSKLVTHLFIKSLKDNGVMSLTVKFSGNKGFHIGVPFEAFPEKFRNAETRLLFPEAARNIASYLLDYISENYVTVEGNDIKFLDVSFSIERIKEMTGKDFKDLTKRYIKQWGKDVEVKEDKKDSHYQYGCPKCGDITKHDSEQDLVLCPTCNFPMDLVTNVRTEQQDVFLKFDPLSIIEVDTVLISTRHLFRAPYSLHEKSGLASVVIDPDSVLDFNKKDAEPERIEVAETLFLSRDDVETGEASALLNNAYDFVKRKEIEAGLAENAEEQFNKSVKRGDYEEVKEAIPEQFFPPCIQKMLAGLEDGRKRSLFVLVNFLTSVGWNYDQVEERLMKWNEANAEPLREVNIKGHIRYHKQNKKKILPPNCSNKAYYTDMQFCQPDNMCAKIKNPVNYAIRRAKLAQIYEMKQKRSKKKEDGKRPSAPEKDKGSSKDSPGKILDDG